MEMYTPQDPRWEKSTVLKRLIIMCGGHWRTLATLAEIIASTEYYKVTGQVVVEPKLSDNHLSPADYINNVTFCNTVLTLLKLGTTTYYTAQNTPVEVIEAALLANSIPVAAMLGGKSVVEWVAFGSLVNTAPLQNYQVTCGCTKHRLEL